MVPQPCLALLLLFPVTDAAEAAKAKGKSWTASLCICVPLVSAE